jgi:hypothetical protein
MNVEESQGEHLRLHKGTKKAFRKGHNGGMTLTDVRRPTLACTACSTLVHELCFTAACMIYSSPYQQCHNKSDRQL